VLRKLRLEYITTTALAAPVLLSSHPPPYAAAPAADSGHIDINYFHLFSVPCYRKKTSGIAEKTTWHAHCTGG
jgi:hypothetical protein